MGNFEGAQQGPGVIQLSGWGLDRGTATPTHVNFYVDGAWLGYLMANSSRPDIAATFPGYGEDHGFSDTLPYSTPGTHQACAWVIGDGTGAPNYGLGCKTVTINNDPVGFFEQAQPVSGGIQLSGWGLDRDTATPTHVNFYVDGAWLGYLMANTSRPDVGTVFLGYGDDHGFSGTLSYSTAGTHQVCGWVIGDGSGAANYGLGCRTVTIN